MSRRLHQGGIACPNCAALDSGVVDSRNRRGFVWRRRECATCYERFTTQERIAPSTETAIAQGRIMRSQDFRTELEQAIDGLGTP